MEINIYYRNRSYKLGGTYIILIIKSSIPFDTFMKIHPTLDGYHTDRDGFIVEIVVKIFNSKLKRKLISKQMLDNMLNKLPFTINFSPKINIEGSDLQIILDKKWEEKMRITLEKNLLCGESLKLDTWKFL